MRMCSFSDEKKKKGVFILKRMHVFSVVCDGFNEATGKTGGKKRNYSTFKSTLSL